MADLIDITAYLLSNARPPVHISYSVINETILHNL